MTTHTKIRLKQSILDQAKDLAGDGNLSALVRDAMKPYLTGNKTLNVVDDPIKETSVVISPEELTQLTTLAQAANISRFEAIRIAVESYLDEQGRL
ncbi:MAG: hypothetical protein JSR83_22555 [Proteobacteria bacterium]|nr:hypothetical protein [Pseudomonadota bacterium]